MKRSLKCCGLLLAFLTIFGLSLNVSSDVSAYKYDINFIPLGHPYGGLTGVIFQQYDFSIMGSTNGTRDYYKPIYPDTFSSKIYIEHCGYNDSRSMITSTDYVYSISYNYYPYVEWSGNANSESPYEYFYCNSDNRLPSDFLISTLPTPPLNNSQNNMRDNLPYRYPFNGFYRYSSYTGDGLHRETNLLLSDLFENNDPPDDVSVLTIPIGFTTLEFNAGDTLTISGEIDFDYFEDDGGFQLNEYYGGLYIVYLNAPSDIYSPNVHSYGSHNQRAVACPLSVTDNADNPDNGFPYTLSYTCDYTFSHHSGLAYLVLRWQGTTNSDATYNPIWNFPDSHVMSYYSSTIVTNFDSSPDPLDRSFQDFEIHTNNPNDVPGYVGDNSDIVEDGVNWTQSLVKMFSFNFLNPFAPIFSLFSPANECASIPIIAGMLHSEETTYCPWFPSSVRNILTPVIGLSSSMLIFGFVVRWLGSSSGNFFEDSRNEEVSNQGGRWGHFKRGGK